MRWTKRRLARKAKPYPHLRRKQTMSTSEHLLVSACLLLTLNGCVASVLQKVKHKPPPVISSNCRAEFNRLVPKARRGALSCKQVVRFISRLKRTELAKSLCGKRIIRTIEAQFER